MDMFLLFVVIFLCVLFAVGISALALSGLFRLMLRLGGNQGHRDLPIAGAPAPAAPVVAPPS